MLASKHGSGGPAWAGALQHRINSNNEYLPRIQDKHAVKFLNDKQKLLRQAIQKVGFCNSGNFGIGQTPHLIEDKFAAQELPGGGAVRIVR